MTITIKNVETINELLKNEEQEKINITFTDKEGDNFDTHNGDTYFTAHELSYLINNIMSGLHKQHDVNELLIEPR